MKLKELRKEKGYSQKTLAIMAGMCTPDVCKIETGRLIPYPKQIRRLADALGVATSLISEEARA